MKARHFLGVAIVVIGVGYHLQFVSKAEEGDELKKLGIDVSKIKFPAPKESSPPVKEGIPVCGTFAEKFSKVHGGYVEWSKVAETLVQGKTDTVDLFFVNTEATLITVLDTVAKSNHEAFYKGQCGAVGKTWDVLEIEQAAIKI